ncbi:ste ste20 ysk protein kinase [Ophiostoma piceae UAMH 11346]|uniref:Ste ste20 ysk protein kinase n=1 Tax=Ophiostoma piceae (strain UAMH 11346) TaxID=1262450 RepID=S3BX25_OPHP1|nr:ste ste20 ysk protein kinase [Ophiostoma piceae UAMH 11346]
MATLQVRGADYSVARQKAFDDATKMQAILKDLVAFCLADDPSQRPPIEQVQHHPYLFGTSNTYPTDTLANLVKGYKLWEAQGGTRKSLFAPGGAQGPMLDHLSSTAMANDEWNFSTTVDFDRSVFANPDSQAAVFDVYGTQVDFETGSNAGGPGGPGGPSGPGAPGGARGGDSFGGSLNDGSFGGGNGGTFSDGATPRPARMKGRRRQPPPQLPAVKVPLEKVFDPNTITNYDENSREYYGLPPPPPTASGNGTSNSDLPLRDDSLHSSLRESLIDLDASFDLSDTSRFADMDTIRAGPSGPRLSVDYDMSGDEGSEYNRPPLSDPADLPNNRRTQEWKFPTMPPPASANPEMFRFPFNDNGERSAMATPSGSSRGSRSNNNSNNNSISISRPAVLVHQHTEPIGLPSQGYDLSVPSMDDSANRMSMSSLIDLDMSMPDPIPDMTRPSTANSDAPSMAGSDYGMANPFDLEKHASIYVPMNSRNREPSGMMMGDPDDESDGAQFSDYDGQQNMQGAYQSDGDLDNFLLHANADIEAIGLGSREEVRDEMKRLLDSFKQHLSFTTTYVSSLPVRHAGGSGLRQEAQIEE